MTCHHFQSAKLLKTLLLVGSLMLSSMVAKAAEKVVVMTSYPQEEISQFEAAFEQAFPQYRLEVLWKTSADALPYLRQHLGEVDVYWSPSRQNFALLSAEDAFQVLDPGWTRVPARLHGTTLLSPKGDHAVTEVAGLGMVIAPEAFTSTGLTIPTSWLDLTNPALSGQIAFPLPSKIGFAGGLIDAMLRGQSWEDGWAMLHRVTLNARFIEHGSTFITDEVLAGRVMVGITMDFFAASTIARGAPLHYVYPPVVAYSPAHVAIFKHAPHPAAAEAFARFTLSPAGQQLLFHPDIRKLPVDPAAYAYSPPGYFNPYATAQAADARLYDVTEQNILNTFFEASLVKHQSLLQSLAVNLAYARHLQRDPASILAIEQDLLRPALNAAQLFTAEHYAIFQSAQADAIAALRNQWAELAKTRYQAAALALQTLLVGQ